MDLTLQDKQISDYFPLKTVGDVLKLFEYELSKAEPNLAILSIVAGEIENSMTNCRPLMKDESSLDLEKCSDAINHNNSIEKLFRNPWYQLIAFYTALSISVPKIKVYTT